MPAWIAALSSKADSINLIFASSFNDTEKVAGIGLAISLYIILLVILMGITMPIETLTSNAYGCGDLRLCGLYLNRTLLVMFGTYVLIAILYFYFVYMKQILLSFG